MKKILFIFISFCFSTMLYGQDVPKTLMWKVTKSGSKNISFLFGTFHEVSPSFFDSLNNVVAKLHQSDVLFVEERISTAKTSDIKKQPLWTLKKWNTILTKEQQQIFNEFVKKADDTSYYNLNPLLLSLKISREYLVYFCQSNIPVDELMDHHIEKIAIKSGKQVYSLDSNQEILLAKQAKASSKFEDSLNISSSVLGMQNMLNDDFSDCKILNNYKSHDLNYQLDLDLTQNPAYAPLLLERNIKWIKILNQSLLSNNCFVAVGFRHLFYKQGLIQQLRSLGYVVTPIPIER